MKKIMIFGTLVSVSLLGGEICLRTTLTTTKSQDPPVQSGVNSSLNSPSQLSARQQEIAAPPIPPPPPPPPPFPGDPPNVGERQEIPRSLLGITRDDLKQIEQYLPRKARVYTYPLGESNLAPALVSADLDGDGIAETVVVYTERKPTAQEGSLPLFLGVLIRDGNKLTLRASAPLAGEVFFTSYIKGVGTPLAARDVTGDNRPEIIVASGSGASLGGALQVFSFNGRELSLIAEAPGHSFSVQSRRIGKPSVIKARSRYEQQMRTYAWNGQRFEEEGNRTRR